MATSDSTSVISTDSIIQNMTTLTTTQINSIFAGRSSLAGLVWFETIAACFTYGFGYIGNLLSFIIFYSQEEFRKISTGLLFLFITISNFFHLWTLMQEFLTVYGIILFMDVVCQCRLLYFVQNVSRAMSTYFMVTISIDRLIRSELPMRSKKICTKRNTIIITFIYLIICSLFWSFYLYPLSTQNPITGSCSFTMTKSYSYFISNLHVPIRAVFVCFIPALIMLLANMRMLFNIRQSQRRVTDGTIIGASSGINVPVPVGPTTRKKKSRRMSALDRMLYYMMVANVSMFLITQIPFHTYSWMKINLLKIESYTATLIRTMLLIWSSLYFGVAFYLYCLASPLFRQKFIKIIKRVFCCQAMPHSTSVTLQPTMIG